MKNIYTLLFTAAVAAGWAAEAPPGDAVGVSNGVPLTPAVIGRLAEVLRTNHPALRAARSRVRAASLGASSIRTWEDPVVRFGGAATEAARGPQSREGGDLVYGVEQKLPLFGKPAAARQVAAAEMDTETARAEWQFQMLRRDLARALFRLAFTERQIEINRQDLAWLHTMVATTEERYRAGTATQVEVLRLQNERARRTNQLRTDSAQRGQDRAAVNRLLGRDLHTPLEAFALPAVAAPVPYRTQLVASAVAHEPRLRMMQRETRAAESRAEATRRSRRPEVSAGLEAWHYSGDGGWRQGMLTVSLNLPWFNRTKYRHELARDLARVEAAEFDTRDQIELIGEGVHHLTVAIDAARRDAVLYRDEILPRSAQALAAAHAQWLASRGLFIDVMESRRLWLEAHSLLARAVSEQHQMRSELALFCGREDLEALERLGTEIEFPSAPSLLIP